MDKDENHLGELKNYFVFFSTVVLALPGKNEVPHETAVSTTSRPQDDIDFHTEASCDWTVAGGSQPIGAQLPSRTIAARPQARLQKRDNFCHWKLTPKKTPTAIIATTRITIPTVQLLCL